MKNHQNQNPICLTNHLIMKTPGKFPSVSRFTTSSQPRYGSLDGRTRHGAFSPATRFCQKMKVPKAECEREQRLEKDMSSMLFKGSLAL